MLLGLQLHRFTLIALLCFIIPVHASGLWQANTLLVDEQNTLFSSPTALLKELLWQAPTHQIGYAGLAFTLPISATQILDVEIFEDAILAPEIAKQYPHLRSFRVHEQNSQRLIGRIDFNAAGFHAMFTHQGQTFFIEPASDTNLYTLYDNSKSNAPFSCQTLEPASTEPLQSSIEYSSQLMAKRFGSQLRVYQLALSADNPYFNRLGSNTYQSMVTATSQVNLIFERDLGIRLELVSNDSLIATSTLTTLSGGLVELLNNNSAWIQQKMPSLHYDIGHVLSAEGGGIATFAGACSNLKAQGATGFGALDPNDQRFYIDYLAHEFAHQLGASHSFNAASNNISSACDNNNRYASSAFEPGSGSTIMSYAGLCQDQNLQQQSDHYFHGHSIEQIRQFVESKPSCGTSKPSTDSHPPVANAGPNYTIPANTPFILQGSATDADGDNNFSYTWEQMDLGPATVTKADMHKDKGQGPIIRSHPPSNKNLRIVPSLEAILQNNVFANNGERLPTTNRQLNFMLTVRSGSHGVDQDTMRLQVHAAAGPFTISTSPTGERTGFTAVPLIWQVANTHLAPINCGFVDIALSTDNGQSFINVLSKVKNNGRASLVLPNAQSSQARLRVKCSNNIFFAISHPSFSITTNNTPVENTVISIHAADAERYEGAQGASTFRFLVKRTGNLAQAASVNYRVVGSGENPADEDDFSQLQLPSGTLHFASGQDSITLTIDVQADNTVEPTENFTVQLSDASANHTIVIDRVEATIFNGEEPLPQSKKRKRGSSSALFTLLLLMLHFYRQSQLRYTELSNFKRW